MLDIKHSLTPEEAHQVKRALLSAAPGGVSHVCGGDLESLARSLIAAFRVVDEATAAAASLERPAAP